MGASKCDSSERQSATEVGEVPVVAACHELDPTWGQGGGGDGFSPLLKIMPDLKLMKSQKQNSV